MLNNLFWYFNLCDIVITSTDNWKASLAQSVERAAFNRKVVGSSPTGSVFIKTYKGNSEHRNTIDLRSMD